MDGHGEREGGGAQEETWMEDGGARDRGARAPAQSAQAAAGGMGMRRTGVALGMRRTRWRFTATRWRAHGGLNSGGAVESVREGLGNFGVERCIRDSQLQARAQYFASRA
jgi:hypothetical protein